MGWTTPADYTAGEVVTAAKLNTHVRDNLRFLRGLDGTISLGATLAGDAAVSGSVVTTAALKNVAASLSTFQWSGDTVNVTLVDFGFFPNISNTDGQRLTIHTNFTSGTATAPRFSIQQASTSTTLNIYYRYLTASGPPDIRIGLDASGNICAVAAAPDPLPSDAIITNRTTQYLQFKPSIQVYRAIASEGEVAGRILHSGLIVSGTALQIGEHILEEVKP